MISIILKAAALGVMMGAASVVPATAEPIPDIDGYLQAMHTIGWHDSTKGDIGLVEVGFKICHELAYGISRDNVAGELHAANTQIDLSDDRTYVDTAVHYLCPSTKGYMARESTDGIFYGVIV